MNQYLLLLLSTLGFILFYLITKHAKWNECFDNFPQKYLVSNKFLLALYIIPPKKKIPIWLFVLYISQMLFFIFVIILYLLFWINASTYWIIVSKWILGVYFLYILCFLIPCAIVHGLMFRKYIEKK